MQHHNKLKQSGIVERVLTGIPIDRVLAGSLIEHVLAGGLGELVLALPDLRELVLTLVDLGELVLASPIALRLGDDVLDGKDLYNQEYY